ncbi:stage III sporulation protein AF [Halobacillus fulvus]|nr:stage III sporulation protein AF [Halobacillus fulvus]
MELFVEWITKIVLFLILAVVADMVLPSGMMRKYAKLVLSILLLLVFLGPLLQVLQINPEQIMRAANRTMENEVPAPFTNEDIETKKNEILQGQDAYKLEQVTKAIEEKLKGPLLEEFQVLVTEVELQFLKEPYELESLDKLFVTISPEEDGGEVDVVEDISIMEETKPETKPDDHPIRQLIAEYLELEEEQIVIRWEEEDE